MKNLEGFLSKIVSNFLENEYKILIDNFEFQLTKKDFEGDLTLVLFPIAKKINLNPQEFGDKLGSHLVNINQNIRKFNIVSGFLNLVITDSFYIEFIESINDDSKYGHIEPNSNSPTLMIEYSSPNTNKPLHLGHIRNNLLGFSISEILRANGNNVIKTQIINDRGIHICKSMVAWNNFGNGETPESSGLKGDQLVGKYYVLFEKIFNEEVHSLQNEGHDKESAAQNAPIMIQAREMLKKWEKNDSKIRSLWKKMNNWVYDGFAITYNNLGVYFDSYYYESDTYLLGKEIIDQGLKRKIFFSKPDGSVWIDLKNEGLDEKILLRSDGTAVYITQDLGTVIKRFEDFPQVDNLIYTVGNEQDYHFKVLFTILKKLGYSWADNLYHLSYGMVDLPQGKMKSREGKVVDADNLIKEMKQTARKISEKQGKINDLDSKQKENLYNVIGLGALKYFILKVDHKKRILFNPEESVDFEGNTGPFIQYAYARIKSLLSKVSNNDFLEKHDVSLDIREKEIIKQIMIYPDVLNSAAKQYSPAIIANYLYELVRLFNSFYQNINILNEPNKQAKSIRLSISRSVSRNIFSASSLLGIDLPEKM
ncbi:MAG: arginine--tRNA ligase [Flavobacteriaceae bacterium]|nr:arginine--tRNA ligase [Flavobacteriaceae bacterium]|tara:strand:+ start:217 stop:1998 length:1782 start_codon:yes stop_codon:yes gene_type:complete